MILMELASKHILTVNYRHYIPTIAFIIFQLTERIRKILADTHPSTMHRLDQSLSEPRALSCRTTHCAGCKRHILVLGNIVRAHHEAIDSVPLHAEDGWSRRRGVRLVAGKSHSTANYFHGMLICLHVLASTRIEDVLWRRCNDHALETIQGTYGNGFASSGILTYLSVS